MMFVDVSEVCFPPLEESLVKGLERVDGWPRKEDGTELCNNKVRIVGCFIDAVVLSHGNWAMSVS